MFSRDDDQKIEYAFISSHKFSKALPWFRAYVILFKEILITWELKSYGNLMSLYT